MNLDDIMAEFADACCAGETRPNAEGAYEFDIDGDRVSFSVTPDCRFGKSIGIEGVMLSGGVI